MTSPHPGTTEPLTVVLRDGTEAVIRPIRPDDKQRLAQGLQQLSSRSRLLRFHTPMTRLNSGQLRYLTEVDYHDHMAWVAENPLLPDEPGMGVARYIRLSEEPSVAEAAVTILDRYQARGLGTLLLEVLAASAISNGIRAFRNYVLADNTAMLDVFEALGGVRVHQEGSVYTIDVALPDAPADVGPDSDVRHVLRAVARDGGTPFRWAAPEPAGPH